MKSGLKSKSILPKLIYNLFIRMMKFIHRLNRLLSKIESAILILTLIIMILLAFLQVILRNFFSSSLLWGDTFLRHLVLWVGFLGASLATKENRHINIDVLSRVLSPRLKKISGIITNFFAATVCFFLFRAAITFIVYEQQSDSRLFADIPVWFFQIIIVVGFGIISLRFLIHAIENITLLKRSPDEELSA